MENTNHPELHVNEEPRDDLMDTANGFTLMFTFMLVVSIIATIISVMIR